jgi:hypothetical protein
LFCNKRTSYGIVGAEKYGFFPSYRPGKEDFHMIMNCLASESVSHIDFAALSSSFWRKQHTLSTRFAFKWRSKRNVKWTKITTFL